MFLCIHVCWKPCSLQLEHCTHYFLIIQGAGVTNNQKMTPKSTPKINCRKALSYMFSCQSLIFDWSCLTCLHVAHIAFIPVCGFIRNRNVSLMWAGAGEVTSKGNIFTTATMLKKHFNLFTTVLQCNLIWAAFCISTSLLLNRASNNN